MVRKKKKIDSSWSRHVTFIKRRDSILRRATDLSTLSDTEVGLMMFSPTGQFTSFASKGRIEDIFIRFLDWCDERGRPLENHEFLRKSLKHLKYEAEILDKIGRIEELERKLADLQRKKYEAEEKLRSCNADMIQKLSISEATNRQQIIMDSIRRTEKLKMPSLEVGSSSAAAEITNSETQRNQLSDDHNDGNIEELEPWTS